MSVLCCILYCVWIYVLVCITRIMHGLTGVGAYWFVFVCIVYWYVLLVLVCFVSINLYLGLACIDMYC